MTDDQMTAEQVWATRVQLARRGWMTELRATRSGIGKASDTTYAFGIWARRFHWSGWIADVCLHAHAIVDINTESPEAEIASMCDVLLDGCDRAERDYVDQIPCQTGVPKGGIQLAANRFELSCIIDQRRNVFPSEAIPEGVGDHVETAPDQQLIPTILSALHAGYFYEDSITYLDGPPRMARDCSDRKWGYRLRLVKRYSLMDGEPVKLSFQPFKFNSDNLHQGIATQLINASVTSLDALFALYAPGGSAYTPGGNGLPPGQNSLEEALAQRNQNAPIADDVAQEPGGV